MFKTLTRNKIVQALLNHLFNRICFFHRAIKESQLPACYSILWPEGDSIAASNALYYSFRSLATCLMFLSNGLVLPRNQLVVLFVVLRRVLSDYGAALEENGFEILEEVARTRASLKKSFFFNILNTSYRVFNVLEVQTALLLFCITVNLIEKIKPFQTVKKNLHNCLFL